VLHRDVYTWLFHVCSSVPRSLCLGLLLLLLSEYKLPPRGDLGGVEREDE
jgi:hypothetical protein